MKVFAVSGLLHITLKKKIYIYLTLKCCDKILFVSILETLKNVKKTRRFDVDLTSLSSQKK